MTQNPSRTVLSLASVSEQVIDDKHLIDLLPNPPIDEENEAIRSHHCNWKESVWGWNPADLLVMPNNGNVGDMVKSFLVEPTANANVAHFLQKHPEKIEDHWLGKTFYFLATRLRIQPWREAIVYLKISNDHTCLLGRATFSEQLQPNSRVVLFKI